MTYAKYFWNEISRIYKWAKDKESRRDCTFIKCNSILLASKRNACGTWQHVWTFYPDYSCRFSEIWFNLVDKKYNACPEITNVYTVQKQNFVRSFQPIFSNGMLNILYIPDGRIASCIKENKNRFVAKIILNQNII